MDMTSVEARRTKTAKLREVGEREAREFIGVAAYMLVIFAAFITYRRLVLHDFGIEYLHYGASVISALVVAKIVLIGQALKVGERHKQRAVIVLVLYKAVLYTVFVAALVAVERIVEGLMHGDAARTALVRATAGRTDEILAQTLILFISFIPFFAFLEVDRVVGEGTLFDVLFRGRGR